jgi:phosphoglucosamine mutase
VRFGTDGVRGVANRDLTPEFSLLLGRAAARVLGPGPFVVGRDTRRSGAMLEAALTAGLCSEGADVHLAGVVPTPAVAAAAARRGCCGAVISASHNPFEDNGIKLFAEGGVKLSDAVQAELEELIDRLATEGTGHVPTGEAVGEATADPGVLEAYAHGVIAALDGRRLDGVRVVLDCANGANSTVAPSVFSELGAQVEVLHADPDGVNINAGCGSTHPDDLFDAVTRHGADLGFAFDGDADRVLAVDHRGELVDGDQLMAVCAIDLRERALLRNGAIAVTVMSNLGLRLGMKAAGIEVVETAVGDRYVLEALDERNLSLGGEQSGHLVFRDLATTGDGLLSAVLVADVVARRGQSLADLAASAMQRLPQVLRNVRMTSRPPDLLELIAGAVHEVQSRLGEGGRVLVRPSGTEPVVRVMVEAPELDEAAACAERIVAALGELGSGTVA